MTGHRRAVAVVVGAIFLGTAPALLGQSNLPWEIGPFTRPIQTSIISPDPANTFIDPILKQPVQWEALNTFNPSAVVKGGKVYVLYRAEDNSGKMEIGMHTSRLGLAVSRDGIHFKRNKAPVFFADEDDQKSREWPGGVEDPRIVEAPDGTYVLTYTQWNRQATSIGLAISKDLYHWKKLGPIFPNSQGSAYHRYKSSGIVTQLINGRLIAARIRGRFWMYWGEGEIHLASSEDLLHWIPIEDGQGQPIVLLKQRQELFDSAFPEVGPPAVLTKDGIVLLYNGKNASENGAVGLDPGAYSGGQALFSADDPQKLLARSETPFFKPELSFEKSGQYPTGTTFIEGLVFFQDKWFLYYGCADSQVGVATSSTSRQ